MQSNPSQHKTSEPTSKPRHAAPCRVMPVLAGFAIALFGVRAEGQMAPQPKPLGWGRGAVVEEAANTPSLFPPNIAQIAQAYLEEGTYRYLRYEPVSNIGFGYSFVPHSASWKLGKPVFSMPTPGPGPILGWSIDVTNNLFSTSTVVGVSAEGSAEASLEIFKAAASFSLDVDYEQSLYENSFTLSWEKVHDIVTPDYINMQLQDLSFAAQQIYAQPYADQAALWEAAIGEYVAVGTRHMSGLELRVSLSSSASSQSIKTFHSLKASLLDVGSAKGKLETLFKAMLTEQSISVSVDGFGVDVPATEGLIPSHISQIDEPHEVQAMYDAFLGQLEVAAEPRGVVLIPSSAFVFSPFGLETESLADFQFGLARAEIDAAMNSIEGLETWMNPPGKFEFLKKHHLPGELLSIGDKVLASRYALIEDFADLWVAVQDHIAPDADISATEPLLNLAIEYLLQDRLAANALLVELQHVAELTGLTGPNDIIISVDYESPGGAPKTFWVTFWNVALFDQPSYSGFALEVANALSILTFDTGVDLTYFNGGIDSIEVLGIYDGPGGVRGVRVRVVAEVSVDNDDAVFFRYTDQLGRLRTESHAWFDPAEGAPAWAN